MVQTAHGSWLMAPGLRSVAVIRAAVADASRLRLMAYGRKFSTLRRRLVARGRRLWSLACGPWPMVPRLWPPSLRISSWLVAHGPGRPMAVAGVSWPMARAGGRRLMAHSRRLVNCGSGPMARGLWACGQWCPTAGTWPMAQARGACMMAQGSWPVAHGSWPTAPVARPGD